MSSVEDKIRALLAVAEDPAASAGEKEAAMLAASRLAQRHSVDIDQLGTEASDFGSSVLFEFASEEGSFAVRIPSWAGPVIDVLQEHFNVRGWLDGELKQNSVRKLWMVFGCGASRKVAIYVGTYLSREFIRLNRVHRPKSKAVFYRSLALGVIARLQDLAKRVNEYSDCLALIQQSGERLQGEFDRFCADVEMRSLPAAEGKYSREAFHIGKSIEINTALSDSRPEQLRIAE